MGLVTFLVFSLLTISTHSFVILPYQAYPTYPLSPLSPVSLLYPIYPQYQTRIIPQTPLFPLPVVQPSISTLDPGLEFSPTRKTAGNLTRSGALPVATTRLASRTARTLDLCYFLGNDIFTSHVPCNPNWGDGTNEGVKQYINELTYEANQMIGENNLRFAWKGPYERHDSTASRPGNPTYDVLSVKDFGCDAVVFLVFNTFSDDCMTKTSGHEFSGVSYGGMCEQQDGLGYTEVVDQGFLGDDWTGPQILAHHLLLMLTSDLNDLSKTCPATESLLHPMLYPGEQRIDQCVVDKLNRSNVSERLCMNP